MRKEDGGSAFPLHEGVANDGMSLRDYFAGQALASLAFPSLIEAFKEGVPRDTAIMGVSEGAYAFADAMLEAREK
jgi:hypothetical protein